MIHIDNISKESFNQLKVCIKLIKEETRNKPYKKVIVFTDDVKTINDNLNSILNLNNINIQLQVVPINYKEQFIGKILRDTIVLEIQMLFNLFRVDFKEKTSYIKYNNFEKLMEVKTKIYEPIIEGDIS